MVGTTLSHYRVLALLGRGGMGEVYVAEDLRLRRKVALKVLPPAMAADPERRRRFEREAQAIAALNHPGIVTIYSVEHEQGVTFLTMELVEGTTLGEIVPSGGLPLAKFLDIAVPLADAVNAAHERGILHRDLKPGNVMVTIEGRVKVLDFGLAKLTERVASPATGLPQGPLTTSDGQIVGTISYMAPEQAEGKPVDHRADIFALGVMLYELAAGVRPFAGETNVSILTSLLRDQARPLSEIRADLPPVIGEILQRCMEKDPEKRYGSAAQLRADLERVRSGTAARRTGRTPAWAYAASVVIVLLTGLGGWWMFQTGSPAASAVESAISDSAEVPVLITGRQVAILDFENRTGDPSLDAFGRMAGEAIAAGLVAKGLPVVSATDASAADGVTISGMYFLQGDELRVIVRLLAASRGTVVRNIEPVSAPRAGLLLAADEIQRRVVSGVLASLDPANPQ